MSALKLLAASVKASLRPDALCQYCRHGLDGKQQTTGCCGSDECREAALLRWVW